MEPLTALPNGFRLGDEYEIIGVLGAGGFGNTYIARDVALGRDVAVKEYFPRDIAHREPTLEVRYNHPRYERAFNWGLERFIQEAKLLAKFRHPNIVRVFRTLDANNTGYIVLDYIRGLDFEAWLAALDQRPTQEEFDELLAPLLDALALVHQIGILHRDIKPANICIREETGDPILLDFGASKYSMGELTGTTMAIVSRGYSPYEAYSSDSGSQGPWTDIYGLGATIYRAMADVVPPEATERLLEDTITSLTSSNIQGYRKDFLDAVDWALSIQPKQRPQNVADWRAALFRGAKSVRFSWEPTEEAASARLAANVFAQQPPTEIELAVPVGGARSRLTFGVISSAVVLAVVGGAFAISQMMPHQADTPLLASGPSVSARQAAASTPETIEPAVVPSRAETEKETQVAIAIQPPRVNEALANPTYSRKRLGRSNGAALLSSVALSTDGRKIAVGNDDGSVALFDTLTGRETALGKLLAPIVAVDFIPVGKGGIAAVGGDGKIVMIDQAGKSEKKIGSTVKNSGFVKALAFNMITNDIVAVDSTSDLTRLSRWNAESVSSEPKAIVEIATSAVRAAAISSTEDFAVVVNSDERIRGFRITTGLLDDKYAFAAPAKEWTTSVALGSANELLARGGHYDTVEVFDGRLKLKKWDIALGEQAQTHSLAFSQDGRMLAIDYSYYLDRVVTHGLIVVDTTTGTKQLNVGRSSDNRRWVGFLSSANGEYWLAASVQGAIKICRIHGECSFDVSAE